METKKSQEYILPDKAIILLQKFLGGALAGVSAASLINLTHKVRMEKQKREELAKSEDEDLYSSPDSIILTLPKEYKLRDKTARELSDPSRMSLVHNLVAILGGGAAGYYLLDEWYNKKRKKELAKELGTVHQEYLDKILKRGEEIIDEQWKLNKLAAFTVKQKGPLDTLLSATNLILALGTSGMAYLTKRYLDMEEKKIRKAVKIPKPTRIILRSEKDESDESDELKEASINKTASERFEEIYNNMEKENELFKIKLTNCMDKISQELNPDIGQYYDAINFARNNPNAVYALNNYLKKDPGNVKILNDILRGPDSTKSFPDRVIAGTGKYPAAAQGLLDFMRKNPMKGPPNFKLNWGESLIENSLSAQRKPGINPTMPPKHVVMNGWDLNTKSLIPKP